MTSTPIWKRIERDGLKNRYEISEVGEIRLKSSRVKAPINLDDNGKKYVMLTCFGVKKPFLIEQLLYDTYRIVPQDNISDYVLKEGVLLKKHEQFSASEEDYALGDNKRHWAELKASIDAMKTLKESIERNEQS